MTTSYPRNQLSFDEARFRIRDADLLLWRPRRWSLGERLAAIAGRGEHCHAAMAAWWDDELMCLESRLRGIRAVTLRSQVERFPGLIDVFAANCGQDLLPGTAPPADVGGATGCLAAGLAPCAEKRSPRRTVKRGERKYFSRHAAVAAMRRKTGLEYGLMKLLRTTLTHCVLARLWFRPDLRDDEIEIGSRRFVAGRPPRGDAQRRRARAQGPEFCSEAVASATRAGGFDPVPRLADRYVEPANLANSPFYEYRFTLQP